MSGARGENNSGADAAGGPVVLVAAADGNFVMPLAAMVRSVLDNLGAARQLCLYVIDGGIAPGARDQLLKSWEDPRLETHWLPADKAVLGDVKISGHVNIMTYCRLLTPFVLPEHLEKAIYLDADMIVERDLGTLWEEPLGNAMLLAAQDMTVPHVDSREALPNFAQCAPYLSQAVALPSYRALGIPGAAKYFNAGLLVMNLHRWRVEQVSEAVIAYLNTHKEEVRYWDQDGLNAVLHADWRELDGRWNQIPHIYRYPAWEESPFARDIFEAYIADPWIVHYSTRSKPWHWDNRHPRRDRYFHYLDRTAWVGWRPDAPVNHIRNSEFLPDEGGVLKDWTAVGRTMRMETGGRDGGVALRIEPSAEGRDVQLRQVLQPNGLAVRRTLAVSVEALCHEPGMLGLNVYLYVDGVRRAFSRNHPGHGRWATLTHACYLPIGADTGRVEVLVVLRAGASRPGFIARPVAIITLDLPSARHPLGAAGAWLFARLPNRLRAALRRWAQSGTRRVDSQR